MNAEGIIDFSKLEKDLFAAVEEDARYQRENDAKFRAVEQKVASYEEFKDIVAASHLRPLDKKDREGLHSRNHPWNPYADKQEVKSVQKLDKQVSGSTCMNVPGNSHEFLKQWQQNNRCEKYCLLMKIGGMKLCEIFKTEISMGLLGEIIDVLHQNWKTEDICGIYEILHKLSMVKRFSLSLQFLSKDEKQTLTNIFDKLEDYFRETQQEADTKVDIDKISLGELKEIYQIKSQDL